MWHMLVREGKGIHPDGVGSALRPLNTSVTLEAIFLGKQGLKLPLFSPTKKAAQNNASDRNLLLFNFFLILILN